MNYIFFNTTIALQSFLNFSNTLEGDTYALKGTIN